MILKEKSVSLLWLKFELSRIKRLWAGRFYVGALQRIPDILAKCASKMPCAAVRLRRLYGASILEKGVL
jgi:hypothetical protein